MKTLITLLIILSTLSAASLACSFSSPSAETPNAQATIDAAIAATATAQYAVQATIDASVAATAAAMPPTPTAGATVEYVTLTEEELAALIDQAVQEAVAASEQTYAASSQATSDNYVTQEELDAIYDYYYLADEAAQLAEAYIEAYYGLYAELAYETLDLLIALEEDLSTIANSLDEIYTVLEVASTSLAQGVELADDTINQINTTVNNATAQLAETQAQSQQWVSALAQDRETRAQNVLSVAPDSVPTDKLSMLSSAFTYVDFLNGALGDQKITREELTVLAQLAANASAGLSAFGGPQLQGLSSKVTEITSLVARGQMPQAREGLRSFESALGQRPAGLPAPNINIPNFQPGSGGNFSPGGLRP